MTKMTNGTQIAGVLASMFVVLTGCAAERGDEPAATTEDPLIMQEGGGGGGEDTSTTTTTTYTCGGSCSVSNNQCLCQSSTTCTCSSGTSGIGCTCQPIGGYTYYYWNPCAYPQTLVCNPYGSCWCQ